MNKYLAHLEKRASALMGGALAHVAQNSATRAAFRSPAVGKSIATSFANGIKGGHEAGIGATLKRAVRSVVAPDVEIAHREANKLGLSIKGRVDELPDRAKAGLRMLSEGRFDTYHKLRERIPEDARKKLEGLASSVKLPDVPSNKAKAAKQLWQSPDHPLLSNIVSKLGRGKPSEKLVPGMPSHRPGTALAALSSIADPGAGAMSTAKMLTQSKHVQDSKVGSAVINKAHEILIKNPAKKGLKQGLLPGNESGRLSKLKEVGYDLGVNSTSASIKRTSSSLGRLLSGHES